MIVQITDDFDLNETAEEGAGTVPGSCSSIFSIARKSIRKSLSKAALLRHSWTVKPAQSSCWITWIRGSMLANICEGITFQASARGGASGDIIT